jgi:hypothetical protein
MKQSSFYKKYFNLLNGETISSPLIFQISFFSNSEVLVFRQLVIDFNRKFNRSILNFYFFSQGSITAFKNKSSSVSYIFASNSFLAVLAFFDSALRLNLGFLITSFSNNSSDSPFTVSFFKAFVGNKFLLQSSFLKTFAERFLRFFKKIEFYNNLRILKFLKKKFI